MKKLNYLIILFVLTISLGSAQIGVNTETPDNTSILDVVSNEKGVLFPRMSTAVRDQQLTKAAVGLMLYNTTEHCLNVNVGTRDLPVWNCLKEEGNNASGRSPVWGTLKAATGSNTSLAGFPSNTTATSNSRTSLFSDFSTVFGIDAKPNGYSQFIAYKFMDVSVDKFNVGGFNFLKDYFDIISVATSTSTQVGAVNLHANLKEFSLLPGKAVFITLSSTAVENSRVFKEYDILDQNILLTLPGGSGSIRVNKVPNSPNENFGNLSEGDALGVGSSAVVSIPVANLPAHAVVYAIENNKGNAVLFSINNVFFAGGSALHEGDFYAAPQANKINLALFIKKVTASMLDYVAQ